MSEWLVCLGFADIHPLQDPATVQGAMELMYELQNMLAEISGFAAVTLQPAAGAHGELTGVLIMRKAQIARGQGHRDQNPGAGFGPRHEPGHHDHERP